MNLHPKMVGLEIKQDVNKKTLTGTHIDSITQHKKCSRNLSCFKVEGSLSAAWSKSGVGNNSLQ